MSRAAETTGEAKKSRARDIQTPSPRHRERLRESSQTEGQRSNGGLPVEIVVDRDPDELNAKPLTLSKLP